MCGLAGFVGIGDQSDLQRMCHAIRYRGPDSSGVYTDDTRGVFLGHQRLEIVDLALGHQPMVSADGSCVMIFNGEIYNAMDLRRQLEALGHQFRTSHSDTEVLLVGYQQWGIQVTDRLNGMWSFAVYDKARGQIVLSRDRFGQKPMYYLLQPKIFAFASEVNCFSQHQAIDPQYSQMGIAKYCAHGYCPGQHTLFQEIKKLEPGHSLVYSLAQHRLTSHQYWSYQIEPDYRTTETQWIEQLTHLLEQAVKRRLIADVEVAVFLSGGLDSSIVGHFAKKHLDQLHTYSIGFENPSFDETAKARYVSRLIGSTHHTHVLKSEFSQSLLESLVQNLDTPLSDSSMLSFFFLCQNASQRVKVALGGDACDELFAGYDTFKALKVMSLLQKMTRKPLHKAIHAVTAMLPVKHGYMSFGFKANQLVKGLAYDPKLWNSVWLSPLSDIEIADLLQTPMDRDEIYSEAIDIWESSETTDLIDKTTQFYVKLFLPDQILVKVDRLSMQNSLEVRSPFLDIDLVNCIRKIPSHWRYKNNQTKYLLKKAAERFLPRSVVYQSKKGFSAPISDWFFDNTLRSDSPAVFTRTKHYQQKWDQHQSRTRDNRLYLWNLYVLDLYIAKFLGGGCSREKLGFQATS